MNAFIFLPFVALLAFFPAAAFEPNFNGFANVLAYAITFSSTDFFFALYPKTVSSFFYTALNNIDFSYYIDLFIDHTLKLIAALNSSHPHLFIWVHLVILSFLLCSVCIVLILQRQAANKLAHVVYNMPNCSSSANADKIAELKNEIDNIKWLLNNNIADSNDVAHKTMEYATKLETLSSQMSNLPVELFEYMPAADALAADHTAKDTVVEPDSSAGDTNSDDSDGTVAGTSTAKSDDETGVWQTVVAKRNPHAANRGQKKAKRNRKAKLTEPTRNAVSVLRS